MKHNTTNTIYFSFSQERFEEICTGEKTALLISKNDFPTIDINTHKYVILFNAQTFGLVFAHITQIIECDIKIQANENENTLNWEGIDIDQIMRCKLTPSSIKTAFLPQIQLIPGELVHRKAVYIEFEKLEKLNQ